MDRETKKKVVAELHEKLKDFNLAVLVKYSGLNVERMTELRNALRKSHAELKVVKNTLLRIASEGTALGVLKDEFKGPLALILTGREVVDATKVLVEFAKKNAQMEFRAGILDGKVLTKEQITALATLPSREILLGKLLSVLVGAQTGLVSVLSAVPRSLVQVLEAYRQKKEAEQ
ncbi:MAG: 50S ribosomal protein L10 [Syntrophales bacterium]|nr:50S ribosomal protein L10 [Syntrophales bacterium]